MVSIIVPVYNCRDYLDRCLKSIQAQTCQDYELILVDDGSTDGTSALCDAWAEKDRHIYVIHQKNGGVSAARNTGIEAAKGEYVAFVDADDWLEPDMIARTSEAAKSNDADMLLFDPYVHIGHQSKTHIDSICFYPESTKLCKEQITPEQLRFVAGTVWRFLYRRTLLSEHQIRFDLKLPLSEDRLFNLIALGCSKVVYYLREPYYHYWINAENATSKHRPDMLQLIVQIQTHMVPVLQKYWGEEFIPIYERVNVVEGALLCVYNAFSPQCKASFAQRRKQVQAVICNEHVQAAISRCEKLTMRQRLVKNKCCWALCLAGIAWNVKNQSARKIKKTTERL